MAMQQALQSAGLRPTDIDYINLHGTATPSNDAAEAKGVAAVFGHDMPCSSTKGATGHTLGAAGAVEAVICALALQHGLIPGGLNTREADSLLQLNYQLQNRDQALARVMSNSFGFGGTNCSLIFGLTQGGPEQSGAPKSMTTQLTAYIDGIGLLGPGLTDWRERTRGTDWPAALLFLKNSNTRARVITSGRAQASQ